MLAGIGLVRSSGLTPGSYRELVEYLLQHLDSRSGDVVYKRLFEVRRHVLLEPFLPGIIHRLREIFKESRMISEHLSKLLIINSLKRQKRIKYINMWTAVNEGSAAE